MIIVDNQDTIQIATEIDSQVEAMPIYPDSQIIRVPHTNRYTNNNIAIGEYTTTERCNIEVRDD